MMSDKYVLICNYDGNEDWFNTRIEGIVTPKTLGHKLDKLLTITYEQKGTIIDQLLSGEAYEIPRESMIYYLKPIGKQDYENSKSIVLYDYPQMDDGCQLHYYRTISGGMMRFESIKDRELQHKLDNESGFVVLYELNCDNVRELDEHVITISNYVHHQFMK
jgi:hypothetical protein